MRARQAGRARRATDGRIVSAPGVAHRILKFSALERGHAKSEGRAESSGAQAALGRAQRGLDPVSGGTPLALRGRSSRAGDQSQRVRHQAACCVARAGRAVRADGCRRGESVETRSLTTGFDLKQAKTPRVCLAADRGVSLDSYLGGRRCHCTCSLQFPYTVTRQPGGSGECPRAPSGRPFLT